MAICTKCGRKYRMNWVRWPICKWCRTGETSPPEDQRSSLWEALKHVAVGRITIIKSTNALQQQLIQDFKEIKVARKFMIATFEIDYDETKEGAYNAIADQLADEVRQARDLVVEMAHTSDDDKPSMVEEFGEFAIVVTFKDEEAKDGPTGTRS